MHKQPQIILPALLALALIVPAAATYAAPAMDSPVADFSTCAKPVWPKSSLRHDEQGTVTLSFYVTTDGTVGGSKILQSSGFRALDVAARDSLSRCKFRPATTDGKPEAAWAKIQYVWSMNAKGSGSTDKWLLAREGAERGEAQAEFDLATLYLANGARTNPSEASRLFKSAAAKNHAGAQATLGQLLMSGRLEPANPVLAAEWLEKAAAQGEPRAQHMLALLQMNGAGVAKNRNAAIDLLRKSHAQKYEASAGVLGMLLSERAASAEETAEGIALLRRAADRHDHMALFTLGRLFEAGHGVPKDAAQAAVFYEKAVFAGNRQASAALAKVRERSAN